MTEWQVDERFLDFLVKKAESDSKLGTLKPFVGTSAKEYNFMDLVNEMRQGTKLGQRFYTTLYHLNEKEFKDYLASTSSK